MIKIIKPKKLKEGDLIGIVSPSDPLLDPYRDKQFKSGLRFLKNLGFEVTIGKNICSKNPKERAKDINEMFAAKNIKAIIASQGGDTSEKLIPFIDFNIIRKNPKIFLGMSDITVLLNVINTKTGLITFHGNDVKWGFGRKPTEYDKTEFFRVLTNTSEKEIPANRERQTIRSGKTKGRLIGGNLRCFLKLVNTEFWPDFNDSILFLEGYKFDGDSCKSLLEKLNRLNVFKKIKGVVIGYIYGLQALKPESKQMEDILLEITKEYDFPILKVNDFGHNTPNTIIPIGAMVKIDADRKEIRIGEEVVL